MRQLAISGLVTLAAALTLATGSVAASAAPGMSDAPAAAAKPEHMLSSIACISAKSCVAVGENAAANHGNGLALAETWNGSRWKAATIKAPPGSIGSSLSGVSCVSSKSCIAVGSYFYFLPDEDTRNVAISESWNGSAWRMTKMSQPADSSASPASISCVSAKHCVAVGELFMPGHQTAFAEIWNGTRWNITKVDEPAHSVSYFSSVSCAAAKNCIAVDRYNTHALAQSWNGARWKILKVAAPAATGPSLSAVYCRTAKYCIATGGHFPNQKNLAALVESWNGKTWKSVKVPVPGPGFANLNAVSCASTKSCLAVGDYHFGVYEDSGKVYAASWNGKQWRLVRVPTPPGGKGSESGAALVSVKCLTASDCIAVGDAGPAGVPGNGFSASWNGHRWRFITIG